MRFSTSELYFKSPEQMWSTFHDVPTALQNTLAIAERCNVSLELDQPHFPEFPLEEGDSAESRFERETEDGFARRLEEIRRKQPDFSAEEEEK